MSRRSMRLLTGGYYRPDGEMNERSSSHQVCYRESPVRVFKKRTGSRSQTLSRNGSQMTTPSLSRTASHTATPCLSFSSLTTEASLRGFWYWYPALTSLLMVAEPAWPGYSTSTLGMNTDPRIVTDFNVFRKEVLDRINKGEAKWKESWTRELDGVKPEMHPGKCWAFKGSQGFLTIALSLPVRVTHVTLEHIPKSLSPTGRIDSATREFAVYGLSGFDEQEEGKFLGRLTYNSDGEPIQTFELPDSVKDVYRAVQLRVLSNWGNPEYSCVYRFRVHGQPLPH